jgi:A/G-specific adenine glycosylase
VTSGDGGVEATPFAARLLSWYRARARDLPWRARPSPWPIWVSEVMAQQTRMEVVVPAWERFVREFPTPAAFAAVDDATLQRVWRGLGYYRRARLLRDGAREVVERHGGEVPRDPAALRALPGVGEYTHAAIASIAFGEPLPAIDGNLERVLARHAAIETPVKSAVGRRAVRGAALTRLDRERPGDWNQAMMDLGSAVCTPRSPDCSRCPVADDCAGREAGLLAELPVLPARRAAVPVDAAAAWIDAGRGRVHALRIPEGRINAGQLELPGAGVLEPTDGPDALTDAIRARCGVRVAVDPEPLCVVRHGITHHRITLRVFGARIVGAAGREFMTAHPDDADAPWTTTARKAFAKLRGQGGALPFAGAG